MPTAVTGVPSEALDPRGAWADTEAYDETANKLAGMFIKNFEAYADQASEEILGAAPKVREEVGSDIATQHYCFACS